jgi:hypothetical protein
LHNFGFVWQEDYGLTYMLPSMQIADMHFGNGESTACSDVTPKEQLTCSDLNTTAFVTRLIKQEAPDLIVFTGF